MNVSTEIFQITVHVIRGMFVGSLVRYFNLHVLFNWHVIIILSNEH